MTWERSVRAEQAFLGAVLLDPAGQHRLLDPVVPGDMYRPWHAQVLAAMWRARACGALPGPSEAYRELRNDPDLPRTVAADAVPLASLMEAAPRTGHAPAYASMVVEGGIRRNVGLAGSRLVQACEGGDLATAFRQIADTRRAVSACAGRSQSLPGRFGREPARPDDPVAHQPGPAPQDGNAAAIGARALRDLVAAPGGLATVRNWLRSEHFARTADGNLYAVMQDMHAALMPVDAVTVAWQAARRGIRAEPDSLTGGTGAFAVISCREVHRRGVLASIAQAGRDLQARASSPASSPGLLMRQASARLRPSRPRPGPTRSPNAPPATRCPAGPSRPAGQNAKQPHDQSA
jgi:DnaB-like helicase N terminal domain